MPLPNITTVKFKCVLPSTGEEIEFRPFLVKEEKALLIARESGDSGMIISAMKDAIKSCVIDETLDITKIPYFDLEYLFLNLRARSVGEDISLSYKHNNETNKKGEHCDAVSDIHINIDEIKVNFNDEHKNTFQIDEKYGVVMKYPTIDTIEKLTTGKMDEQEFMASCIETMFDAENVYHPDSLKDATDFVNKLTSKQYEVFSQFFDTMPKIQHEVKYHCPGCGEEETVRFEGASDFF